MCDLLHYLPHALKVRVLQKAFAALRPGGWLVMRDAFAADNWGHRLTVWSERWGVRLGQNKTACGLQLESLAQHRALLTEVGFVDAQTPAGAGLGSNRLLVARKPPGAGPTASRVPGEGA
jgi:hypothetical protein